MSCEIHPNKMAFPDKASAMTHVKVGKASKSDLGSKKLRPYLCSSCEQWHLTSVSNVTAREIRKALRKHATD